MSSAAIHRWVKSTLVGQAAGYLVFAPLALAAGLLALFLTFWLAYGVLFVCERGMSAASELVWNHRLRLAHAWRLALCGAFVLALVVGAFRRSSEDSVHCPSFKPVPYAGSLSLLGGPLVALGILLARPQASAWMITEFLYVGPRLVFGAGRLAHTGLRWCRLDHEACARALAVLASRDQAVSPEELVEVLPEMNWERLRKELAWIPGVVFLETKVSLTKDFRQELRRMKVE